MHPVAFLSQINHPCYKGDSSSLFEFMQGLHKACQSSLRPLSTQPPGWLRSVQHRSSEESQPPACPAILNTPLMVCLLLEMPSVGITSLGFLDSLSWTKAT